MKSLADHNNVLARLKLLEEKHILPLTRYVENLRQHGFGQVPYFDPLDGGINSRVLFLMEKPGPKAAISNFISRDNNDNTASNIFKFTEAAGILRENVCLWNIIPGWNGTIRITSTELKQGVECINDLITMLTQLKAIILIGKKAQTIKPLIEKNWPDLTIINSYHPSPINYAVAPEKWLQIPHEWKKIAHLQK